MRWLRNRATRKHTVVAGDTLWALARRHYGAGTEWPRIYAANQARVRADATAAGLWKADDPGHWIFPGQVLTIPQQPGGAPMRRFLLAAAIALAALLTPAQLAGAQEIPNDAPAVEPVAQLTLSAFTVLIITSLLIPVATGLVTKLNASPTVKQIVTAAIAAAVGVVTTSTQVDGTAVISLATLQYALLAFLIATAGYVGLYKPHALDAQLVPDAGLG